MRRRDYDRNYDGNYGRNYDRSDSERYGRRSDTNYGRGDYAYSGGYPSDFDSDTGGSYFGGGMRYGEGYSSGDSFGGYGGGSSTGRSYGGGSDYDRDYGNIDRGNNYSGSDYGRRSDYNGQDYYDRNDRQNQNWGSSRSDYGEYAYGGDLNDQGMDRQSHRGKGPKNYTRSDDRIKEDVNDRLSDSHYIDASNIEVSVSDGEVTLSGTVGSRYDKRRAEDLADNVSGVNHTQNNLRVSQSGSGGSSTSSGMNASAASSTASSEKSGSGRSKTAST